MKMKTFQGRSIEEILPQIREELGDDAVVLSQRPLVSGGVGGFFGKRMIEVTAADRMPTDEQLIELEDDPAAARNDAGVDDGGPTPEGGIGRDAARTAFEQALAARSGRIDVVDDWDPARDEELAEEYGGVLERASLAGTPYGSAGGATGQTPAGAATPSRARVKMEAAGYEPLELEQRESTVQVSPAAEPVTVEDAVAALSEPAPDAQARSRYVEPPDVQARRLAARAHRAIAEATREIEEQLATSRRTAAAASTGGATFRAEVVANPEAAMSTGAPAQIAVVTARPAPDTAEREQVRQLQVEMCSRGVDADVAEALLARVVTHRRPFASAEQDLRSLTREVAADMVQVDTGWKTIGRAHRIAVVGASGSGKSSVVAKVAESYSRQVGMSVGVISIVPLGGGSDMQGDPLLTRPELDVRFVSTPEQMLAVIERLREVDLVLVDTPSSAYLDDEAFAAVARCLATAHVDEVHAVIPLATSLREAESVVEHFRPLGVSRLTISKLDESRFAGQLLNFGFRFGLPITYLSDGPRIPEDLRAASAGEIANLIVPSASKQFQG